MKKIFYVCLLTVILSLHCYINPVFALPTLQLDIKNGTYNKHTETVVAGSNLFTLYAYLIPDSKNTTDDWYFISAALLKDGDPLSKHSVNAGSFTFNGNLVTKLPGNGDHTISATSEMVYGTPPLESKSSLQGFDPGDLAKHDIFDTYFAEFGFKFSTSSRTVAYNTADYTGAGLFNPGTSGAMFYSAFTVDTSLIKPGYSIHFDLYNKQSKNCQAGADCDITQFAPFSHDAESPGRRVPEPATLILLGAGILGLGVLKKRIIKP